MFTKYRFLGSLHNDRPLCGLFPIFGTLPEFSGFTLVEIKVTLVIRLGPLQTTVNKIQIELCHAVGMVGSIIPVNKHSML